MNSALYFAFGGYAFLLRGPLWFRLPAAWSRLHVVFVMLRILPFPIANFHPALRPSVTSLLTSFTDG